MSNLVKQVIIGSGNGFARVNNREWNYSQLYHCNQIAGYGTES